ncbi:DUF5617 domain-containing protein [Legionella dresdenensis]|uniref:DUF5617 domain-containing protein n=1 Tax=Legionella dresdenensis TaxID=450200 RepID=A0ABV8CGU7_9GAMM
MPYNQHYFFDDPLLPADDPKFSRCAFYKTDLSRLTGPTTFKNSDFYAPVFDEINLAKHTFEDCKFHYLLPATFLNQLNSLPAEKIRGFLLNKNTFSDDFIFQVIRANCTNILQEGFKCGFFTADSLDTKLIVYNPVQFAIKYGCASSLPILFQHCRPEKIAESVDRFTWEHTSAIGNQKTYFISKFREEFHKFLTQRQSDKNIPETLVKQFVSREEATLPVVYSQQDVPEANYGNGEAFKADAGKMPLDLAEYYRSAASLEHLFKHYEFTFKEPRERLNNLLDIAIKAKALQLIIYLVLHSQATHSIISKGLKYVLANHLWTESVNAFLNERDLPSNIGTLLLMRIMSEHSDRAMAAFKTFLTHPNCTRDMIVAGSGDLLVDSIRSGSLHYFNELMASRHVYPELLSAKVPDRHSGTNINILQYLYQSQSNDRNFDSLVTRIVKHPNFTAAACGSLAEWEALFPKTFPGSKMEQIIIQHSFRPKYATFFKAKSSVRDGVIALLEDYTCWFTKFHWGRHHVQEVEKLLRDIKRKPAIDNAALLEQLETFMNKLGKFNQTGSLSRRMAYIQNQLRKDIFEKSEPASGITI